MYVLCSLLRCKRQSVGLTHRTHTSWTRTPVRRQIVFLNLLTTLRKELISHEKKWWFGVHNKSILVYALHSLEYVVGLARFRMFVPKLLLLLCSMEYKKCYLKFYRYPKDCAYTVFTLNNLKIASEEHKTSFCKVCQLSG